MRNSINFSPQNLREFLVENSKKDSASVVQGLFASKKKSLGHVLYTPLLAVTEEYQEELEDLVGLMHKTMLAHDGIGIAANQIGVPLQIFLMEALTSKKQERYQDLPQVSFHLFINPRIIKASTNLLSFWHGCLSAKSQDYGELATYQWVDYEAKDLNLAPLRGQVEGMSAVIFQHEFRHLLGGTYVDYAKNFLSLEKLEEKMNLQETKNLKPCGKEIPHILSDYKLGDKI